MIPEEMAIVTIVPVTVVVKNCRANVEPANYVSVMRVVIVVPVITVRVRIISPVIVAPAPIVPTVMFPTPVPMFLFVIIIVSVVFSVGMIIIHISWTILIVPVTVATFIIAVGFISLIRTVDPIKISVITDCSSGASASISG